MIRPYQKPRLVRSPIQVPQRDPFQLLEQITRLVGELKNLRGEIEKKYIEIQQITSRVKGEKSVVNVTTLPGRPGRDGRDADEKKIIRQVYSAVLDAVRLPKDGRDGQKGKDANPEDVYEIIKKKKIKPEDIEGYEQTISVLRNFMARGGVRGGGDTVAAGSGVTITQSNGVKTISATAGATSWRTITGTIDGVTTVFTIPSGGATDSSILSLNGQILRPTTDYAISGTTLTYVTAPPNGSVHTIFF